MVSSPTSTLPDRRMVSQAITTYAVLMSSDPGMGGYKYASFEDIESTAVNSMVHGDLVLSGMWSGADPGSCDALQQHVLDNMVSEEEALDGAQTMLGKPICFEHESPDGNVVYTYGIVSHVQWDELVMLGRFSVAKKRGAPLTHMSLPTKSFNVVSEVNLCLQPMQNKPVNLFRKVVASRTHAAMDEAWGQIAKMTKRNPTTMRRLVSSVSNSVDVPLPAESQLIPCFNYTQGLVWLQIGRVLDHLFYVVGARAGKKLPESMFTIIGGMGLTASDEDGLSSTPKRGSPPKNKVSTMRKEVTFTSPVFQSAKKDLETSFQVDLESGEDDEALQDALSEEDDDGLTRGFSSCEVSSEGEDAGLRRRVVKRDSFKEMGPTSKRQCPRIPTKESFSDSVQMGNVPSQNFSFGVQRTGPDLTNQ